MSAPQFARLPEKASSSIQPFTIDFPESEIKGLIDLLKLTPVAESLYENSLPDGDRHLGVRRDWLLEAKKYWEEKYDWKKHEAHFNTFPHFKVSVTDELGRFNIHFVALFSERSDAVPIFFYHGWPGSFIEFIPILDIVRKRYSPEELPYHFIVPSLPGYAFSSAQPVNKDLSQGDVARIMNSLAIELGFGDAYLVQGGDVGSRVARLMGVHFDGCKGVHLNFCPILNPPPDSNIESALSPTESDGLKRWQKWKATGTAYAMEHGTRPSTIGFILSSNPLALLAWIGEKFLDWTDKDPDLDTILTSVSLYWLTKCAHSNLWSYRHSYSPDAKDTTHPSQFISKPLGYSYFKFELIPAPICWVKLTGNLVWSKIHDRGGHFAALEEPELLLEDVITFSKGFGEGVKGLEQGYKG